MKRIQCLVAGSEMGGWGLCSWSGERPLEVGKGKEMHFTLKFPKRKATLPTPWF